MEALLAEGGLGPPAGLDTMRPRTGARVVAPAASMDRTHPSPARPPQNHDIIMTMLIAHGMDAH